MRVVDRNSWHARAFRWTGRTDDSPSFCAYWAQIFIGIPAFCVLLVALCWMVPIVWVIERIEKRCKGKEICPFGRIEFK